MTDHHQDALYCLQIPSALIRDDDSSPAGDRMIQEAQVHALLAVADAIKGHGSRPDFAIDATYLDRQRAFSDETFGPGIREAGVIDHIRKELDEIASAETLEQAVEEWVDVILLAFDGATRTGVPAQEVLDAVLAKQERNERLLWPDWRTQDPNKAIEHIEVIRDAWHSSGSNETGRKS